MKFISTFALGLFAMNAMALPVLHEPELGQIVKVYKDHEDPNKMYYMPDSVQLMGLEAKKPEFVIFKTDDEERNFHIDSKFEPVLGKALLKRLEYEKQKGKEVSVLKADHIELSRIMFEGEYNGYGVTRCTEDLDSKFAFQVYGREESVMDLVTRLKETKEKVSLAKVCHLVSGMTPYMFANVTFNEAKIVNAFMDKLNDEEQIKQQDAIEVVKKLVLKGHVRVVIAGGDAKIGDYIYEITNKVLSKYFSEAFEDYEYERNEVEPQDLIVEMTLEGQEPVTKPLCQDLDVSPIRDYPELLNF